MSVENEACLNSLVAVVGHFVAMYTCTACQLGIIVQHNTIPTTHQNTIVILRKNARLHEFTPKQQL